MAKKVTIQDRLDRLRTKEAVKQRGLAKKAKPADPVVVEERVIIDGIDITMPGFLKRERGINRSREVLIAETKAREWAPIKKKGEWTERPSMPVVTENPALPVRVQVKEPGKAGSTLLAEYLNFADFQAKHDAKSYPLKGNAIHDGFTIVLVGAKPWAGRVAKAPSEKKPSRSKTDLIAALLVRPEGCVTADILEATGWPAVSVPAQAKLAGLTLRKEKQGKATRYWGSK